MTNVQISATEREFGRAAMGFAGHPGAIAPLDPAAPKNLITVVPSREGWRLAESLHRRGLIELVVEEEGVVGKLGRAYRLTREMAHACLNPGETLGADLERFPLMDPEVPNLAEFRADAVSTARRHDFATICDALAAAGFDVVSCRKALNDDGCVLIEVRQMGNQT